MGLARTDAKPIRESIERCGVCLSTRTTACAPRTATKRQKSASPSAFRRTGTILTREEKRNRNKQLPEITNERPRRTSETSGGKKGKKGKRREPSQLNDEENEFLNDPFPQPDPGVSNSRREQTDGGSNKQAAIGAPRERPTASLGFCAHVFFVLHLNPFRTSFFFSLQEQTTTTNDARETKTPFCKPPVSTVGEYRVTVLR